jgi:hypothetical protein
MSRVTTKILEELQLKCLLCCNWSVVWVAIHLTKIIKITCLELQLKCLKSCNWVAYRVATGVLVELQLKCLRSCNWSTCWVATVLTLQLQHDGGSSCKQCTLLFRLILYYSFSCNPIVLRVVIIHYELQILSTSSWYCTPLSFCNRTVVRVANDVHSKLQVLSASAWYLYYPISCNWTVVWVAIYAYSELQILSASTWYCTTPIVATGQWFKLQSMSIPSCKNSVLLPDTIPFNCNLTVVRVAIDIHIELQMLSVPAWYWNTSSVATEQWFELQSM